MWRRLSASVQFAGVLLVLVLVLAACTEPEPQTASPDALVGEFVLESINGQPVPQLDPPDPDFSRMIMADTFAFNGHGRFTRHLVRHYQSLTDSTQSTQSSLGTGTYVVSADTVVDFSFFCPPGAACIPRPRAFLQPTGDLLLVYGYGLNQEWRYRRVR